MQSSVLARQFQATVDAEGLRAAMRWLNQQVPYRFTAIFRFDGDMLRNICFVDKQNPELIACTDQPIMDSYCIYIHRTGEEFRLENSIADQRVAGHPKQQGYLSYYGIPLFDRDNRMLGTVCHFDQLPVHVTEAIVSALDELGPLISDAAFPVPGH
jgi:GAF domain-containing protein